MFSCRSSIVPVHRRRSIYQFEQIGAISFQTVRLFVHVLGFPLKYTIFHRVVPIMVSG